MVAVEEQDVRDVGHIGPGNGAAAIAGADQQPSRPIGDATRRGLLDPLDQLVAALRLQDRVRVERHVDLVGDLDDHIAVAAGHDPCGGVLHRGDDGGLVGQALVLAEIEVPEDHDHPELIGALDDPAHARGVVGPQTSVGLEGGVVPGLFARVALRAAALEVDR